MEEAKTHEKGRLGEERGCCKGEMEWRMTGGVERMDDDCECIEGEGVMIGDGSGGADGEKACEGYVGEGEVGGIEREVGKGEKSENEKGEWGDTCVVVVASVSSSAALLSFGLRILFLHALNPCVAAYILPLFLYLLALSSLHPSTY